MSSVTSPKTPAGLQLQGSTHFWGHVTELGTNPEYLHQHQCWDAWWCLRAGCPTAKGREGAAGRAPGFCPCPFPSDVQRMKPERLAFCLQAEYSVAVASCPKCHGRKASFDQRRRPGDAGLSQLSGDERRLSSEAPCEKAVSALARPLGEGRRRALCIQENVCSGGI